MPRKVADEFLSLNLPADKITDKTGEDYPIGLHKDVDPDKVNLNTLWDVDDKRKRGENFKIGKMERCFGRQINRSGQFDEPRRPEQFHN
jgi:hypothetical protein